MQYYFGGRVLLGIIVHHALREMQCDWIGVITFNGLLVWGCAPVGSSILYRSSDGIPKPNQGH